MIGRAIACVLLWLTLLAAGPSPQPTVIRIGLVNNDDAATPLLYALSAGLFAKAGLDVQLQLSTSGAAVTAAVMAGTFDMGKSSIVPLINAHQHDLPVTIVAPASIWNGKSEFAALVVRADSPVKTGKDLEGKLIGVQSLNDMNQVATDAWVAAHGGDPSTLRFVELPMTSGAAALKNGRIDAAAFVEPVLADALTDGQLRTLPGVGADMTQKIIGDLTRPQFIFANGKKYTFALRPEQTHFPFSMTLLQTTHSIYLGTDIPKDFRSRIQLQNPRTDENREVEISMNHPLRYAGLTFYQYQMDAGEVAQQAGLAPESVLEVVRNPSWLTPYIGCALVAAGLVTQFLFHLVGFISKRKAK